MTNIIQKMSAYKVQVEKCGTPITQIEYKELTQYAKEKNIKLSGFKKYVGDIDVIKQVMDGIERVAKDFPKIIEKKSSIVLELDYDMGESFATTRGKHIICLNAIYYSNLEMLVEDYNYAVSQGRFVRGTNWHSIIFHETGHVVANLYNLDPMIIAMDVLGKEKRIQVLEELENSLSLYSTEYEDGREIISEAFSGYYGFVGNLFADEYVKKCKSIIQGGNHYESIQRSDVLENQ